MQVKMTNHFCIINIQFAIVIVTSWLSFMTKGKQLLTIDSPGALALRHVVGGGVCNAVDCFSGVINHHMLKGQIN